MGKDEKFSGRVRLPRKNSLQPTLESIYKARTKASGAGGVYKKKGGALRHDPFKPRQTFITSLLDAGATVRYVMDRAVHRRLSTTTRRYLRITREKKSPLREIRSR